MNAVVENIKEAFHNIGYENNWMNDDYKVKINHKNIAFDVLLFGDAEKKDIDTSCVAVGSSDIHNEEDYIEACHTIGAPIFISVSNNDVTFYQINRERRKTHKFKTVEISKVHDFIEKYRFDFIPQSLLERENFTQLSLFSLDNTLKEFAKSVNKKILTEQIELAVSKVLECDKIPSNEMEKRLMTVLTCIILNDKGYLDKEYGEFAEMFYSAKKHYPGYFQHIEIEEDNETSMNILFEYLRVELVYESLTEDMMGAFYETFLVTPELRKKLGIHYTPGFVSNDIVSRMNFEDIPKDKRVVLDGTCGQGSLLLASYDRMYKMFAIPKKERVKYIKEHIIGIDIDKTATDIMKLCLLLKTLDSENDWRIYGGNDFLKKPVEDCGCRKSTIIVANPPYSESQNRIKEVAQDFVLKYIDILEPNGIMGIVLPATFLEKDSCRLAREKIWNECTIVELWNLPSGVFAEAQFSTIVLILQKKKKENSYTLLRYLKNKNKYKINNKADYASFVPAFLMKSKDKNSINMMFDYNIWKRLTTYDTLGMYYEVKNGLQVIGKQKKDVISQEYEDGYERWLATAKDLESFKIIHRENSFIDLSDDKKVHRIKRDIWNKLRGEKIIMNAKYNPDMFWRLNACIDVESLFPNETFHVLYPIYPEQINDLEWIEMILNSVIANLWLYTYARKRTISPEIVKQIPYHLPDHHFQSMKMIVKELRECSDINTKAELFDRFDDLMMDTYEFSFQEKARVKKFLEGFSRKKMGKLRADMDISQLSFEMKMIVSGYVQEIDLEQQKLITFVQGEKEPVILKVQFDFPGWMLEKGRTFHATAYYLSNSIIYMDSFYQLGTSWVCPEDMMADFLNSNGGE